jgi:hypothetical protein
VRSTCDKVNRQILFRAVSYLVSREEIQVERKPTVALGTSDRLLLFPHSASDEKTAPVAAPPLGPLSNMQARLTVTR